MREMEPFGVDGNGAVTERRWIGGQEVIFHYVDHVPDSDITTVKGIRCTTALRTVIDLAAEVETAHLVEMVQESFDRKLFTVEEAWRRLGEPDMANSKGAQLLRRVLPRRR
jgi:hypothetical protein